MLRQKVLSRYLVPTLYIFLVSLTAQAQTFDSGSTGADGALVLTTPGTVIFDPTSFDPPLDPERDNVYHFTSITIGEGVTVRLSADYLGGQPLVWLVTGDVVIEGVLDLDGEDGHRNGGVRRQATPGAGGFHGGLGRFESLPATSGEGPGGGDKYHAAGHVLPGNNAGGGASYGNVFLIPLIGGSGGGGAQPNWGNIGGGAGGGAILVASSSGILIDGVIQANGGKGGLRPSNNRVIGGSGSGGAIRIMAPILEGSGSLSALGGKGNVPASAGRISLETSDLRYAGDVHGFAWTGPILRSVFPPAEQTSSVRLTQIAGIDVPPKPTGSFRTVDLTLGVTGEIGMDLESNNVPPGTVVHLTLTSDIGERIEFSSTPLEGTHELSTATATATLPIGFSRFNVLATWTPTL